MEQEWAELLQGVAKSGKTPPGKGWMTFDEVRAKHGLSENKGRRAIRELRANGKIEVYRGAVVVDGVTHPKVWYRPKGGVK